MYAKLKKIEEGFTIVEVLIVLAIAALILAIVLIAVPDLQRSSRNTDVFHDAQNIASGIQTYEGNNQGQLPFVSGGAFAAPTTNPSTGPTITAGSTAAATSTAQVQASDSVYWTGTAGQIGWSANPGTGRQQVAAAVGVGYLTVVVGSTCNSSSTGPASGSSLTGQSDPRAVAVYYPIETSSGGNVGCIQE